MSTRDGLVARPARPGEAERIASLSAPFVEKGLLIDRTTAELAQMVEEFVVACEGDRLVGCAGMAPVGASLVVYNLCIAADCQGRGIGRQLVGLAASIGKEQGYQSLLALTRYSGEWFGKLGFSNVPASETRDEWRTLFRPGRRSSLYRLRLASDSSRD
ncbi:GNAT family N-acetyltransferase [Streptomyces sp. NPDC048275]|uniref:GNAT family N-acetyltransferase n=1 Tax=Streptomyces sp. NPDC048275 TaxID=3155629 RepID=UPI0033C17FCC